MNKHFQDRDIKDIKNASIDKGKRGIKSVVFGRTAVLLFCFALQLLLLFLGMTRLAQYVYVFFGGYFLFGLLVLLIILNRTENPAFQLAWASLVLLFPLFGGLFYLYIELQPGTALLDARVAELDEETADTLKQDPEVLRELNEIDCHTAQLANYVRKNGYPIYRNVQVKYFPSGETKYEELLRQLKMAEKFIFLEYFIIAEGHMWDSILEILEQKVKEGVEVRLMYDGTNEMFYLPHEYVDKLRGMGIHCKIFSPVTPIFSTHYNNRDHRKIVVIDGRIAFTGGVNLADEYINYKERFGHWKDAAIMVEGEAVKSFTLMFLKMWAISDKAENMAIYLRTPAPGADVVRAGECEGAQGGFIMPYAEHPFAQNRTAKRIYLDILNTATRYVHIMTPYLVPDYELSQALIYAARRGVDVKLLLPHIPDKKYAFALAHSYYKRLISAGVKIYEYTPGFVHSKVFVSDDIRAVVGAINLDFRSLYLHFECAAFLYGVSEISEIENDFRATLPKCQLITMFDVRHDKLTRKVAGQLMRLVAPLM